MPRLRIVLPFVAAGVFILAFAALLETLSLPYIGVDINYLTGTLAEVDPVGPAGQAGLQVGARVLAIDGQPPHHVPLFGHKAVGEQVVYRVMSQGAPSVHDVVIPLVPRPPERRLSLFALFAVFLSFWGVGTLLLLLRPEEPGVRLFFLACMTAVGLVVLVAADANVDWANGIMYLAVLGSAPLLVHLHLVFPVRRSYPRALLWGLYGGAVCLALLRLLGDPVHRFPLPGLALFRGVVRLYWMGAALAAMGLLVHAYFTCHWGPIRRQIRLITFGTVAALLPITLLLFPADALRGLPVIPSRVGSLSLVLIPLAYGWAVYKRDLVGLDLFLQRVLALTFVGLILAAGYLALAAVVAYGLWEGPGNRLSHAVIAVLLGFAAVPLNRVVPAGLFRAFYPAAIDERTIARLSQQLIFTFCDGGDLSPLAAAVVRALNLQRAVLLLVEGEHLVVRAAPGCASDLVGRKMPLRGWLATRLRDATGPLASVLPTDASVSPTEQQVLDGPGIRLWLPFVFDGELLGALLLGPKLTDDVFLPSERRLLAVLGRQMALLIKNVQLVNVLRARRDQLQVACDHLATSREEERRRLALELHDGPLQQLAGVRMLLAQAARAAAEGAKAVTCDGYAVWAEEMEAAQAQLSDAIQELRRICNGLHPLTLDRLGLVPALRSHVEEVARRTGVPVTLTVIGDEALRFAPAVEIAVFRVAQEALTNACKHAQASQVRVHLELVTGRVSLTVRDDGRGFAVPEQAVWGADGHFGLVSMHQRVQALNGCLEIRSISGEGTTVFMEVPVTLRTREAT